MITNRIVIQSSYLIACLMGCLSWELLMSQFEQSVFICIRSFQTLLKDSLVTVPSYTLCYIWFKWAHRSTTASNTVLSLLKKVGFLIFEMSVNFTTFKRNPCQFIKYIFLRKIWVLKYMNYSLVKITLKCNWLLLYSNVVFLPQFISLH